MEVLKLFSCPDTMRTFPHRRRRMTPEYGTDRRQLGPEAAGGAQKSARHLPDLSWPNREPHGPILLLPGSTSQHHDLLSLQPNPVASRAKLFLPPFAFPPFFADPFSSAALPALVSHTCVRSLPLRGPRWVHGHQGTPVPIEVAHKAMPPPFSRGGLKE